MNEQNTKRNIDKRRYLIVFLLTITIFLTGFIFSDKLNKKRIVDLGKIEDSVSIDILSSEIQFNLLKELSCKGITEKTVLSNDLKELAQKLTFMENNIKDKSSSFLNLKKKYTLLQLKDYFLMKELSKKCKLNPINIIYFYSNKKNECESCKKQGYVLTKLLKDNPRLRVYAFDYNLDISALKTLKEIYKVKKSELPVLIIDGKKYTKYKDVKEVQKILPKLKIIQKKFLELPNGEKSKVEIQCAEDKQCEINKKLETKCGLPVAINKENSEENILEYNKKLEEYQKENDTNCNILTEYTDEVYCSKDNLCGVKEKNK